MKEQKKSNTDAELLEESAAESIPDTASAPKKKKSRLKKFLLVMAAIILLWWFNNYSLKTVSFTIYSDKIVSPLRIAVLSDLHATEYGISNEKILGKIEKADPDLVFMLGDMYSTDSTDTEINIAAELVDMVINAGYTVYFVTGEHDNSDEFADRIADLGAHVMDYTGEYITVNGNKLQILGIDNVYFSPTFDLNNAFSLAPDCYSILMAHIPNYDDYSAFGADLTLCGDTHGGIIQLPFDKGPVYYSETRQWFPEISGHRADVFDKGIFPYNGGNMFITSGIGNSPVAARFNNRPEIAVIDIKPQE